MVAVGWGLLAAWAVAFAWSILGVIGMDPTGDGFTRGLNRVSHVMAWQALCIALAIAALPVRARLEPGPLRRLLLVPIALAVLLILAVAALIAWSWLNHAMNPPVR